MRNKVFNKSRNQKGMVSIVVTIVIMLLISIMLITFARLVRREQRQAADRQLNTQAFYAAETGINDAVEVIKGLPVGASIPDYSSTCDGFINAQGLNNKVGDPADGVSYSCLFVDPSPNNLDFSNVDVTESKVFPVEAKDNTANITDITIGWEDKSGVSSFACPASGSFPKTWPGGCTAGIMRVDIVPFNGPMSRDDFAQKTFTAFLYPRAGGPGTVSYDSGRANNQGAIVDANCANRADRDCTVKISGLPGGNHYYMRIKSIYRASAATVCSPTCGSGSLELVGGQVLVDATGKAADVLKRIQVRVPVTQSNTLSEFAIQTNDTQCKRLAIVPPAQVILNSPASTGGVCDPAQP